MAIRTERTEWQDATIEEKVAEYEYYRARDAVVNRAKDAIERLKIAMREIEYDIERLEQVGADAYAKGATPEQATKEEVKRTIAVAQTTTETVTGHVSNMNLGYFMGEVAALNPARDTLLRAQKRVADLREAGANDDKEA